MRHQLRINCAPVLTLWGDVVAEHLGYDRDAALPEARAAMKQLAGSCTPAELARRAYNLSEQFRPDVPAAL